jgi:hypothetical protein
VIFFRKDPNDDVPGKYWRRLGEERHAFIVVSTFPARKQRMKSYKEVDKPHAFRHRGLDQGFIPTICDSFEMSGE